MKTLARFLLLFSVLLLGLQLGVYLSSSEDKVAAESLRQLPTGPVIGKNTDHQTHAWLGIPYGQSTAGSGRWRAPRKLEPWVETRESLDFGDVCPQLGNPSVTFNPLAWYGVVGSEDCLFLNVWAPKYLIEKIPQGNQRLPVMLWIHGGGNAMGSANTYDMAKLARTQQVIVVSINYRLGVLGWFSHPALRESSHNAEDASGNYGVLDMIQSLHWVQENIYAFGGDPDKVTIFGESAGGRNVVSLLASPLAKGLFHRAIVQSGLTDSTPMASAENYKDEPVAGYPNSSAEIVLKRLIASGEANGRDDAKRKAAALSHEEMENYLRSQAPEDLITLYPEWGLGMYHFPKTLRDGVVLPKEDFLERFANPNHYNAVPIITGANRDEVKMFLVNDSDLVDKYFGLVHRIKDKQAYERINQYRSDYWRAEAVDRLASVVATAQPGQVWAYRFDWDEGGSNMFIDYAEVLGAAHSLELPFVFGQWFGLAYPGVFTEEGKESYYPVSEAMMSYWGAFAHHGNPGRGLDSRLTPWQPWPTSPASAETTIVFDSLAGGGIRMVNDRVSVSGIKEKLKTDMAISDQHERCGLYVDMFYQTRDWQDREYNALGCQAFKPEALR